MLTDNNLLGIVSSAFSLLECSIYLQIPLQLEGGGGGGGGGLIMRKHWLLSGAHQAASH